MNILEEAIVFATKAHEGQIRKIAHTPYILHPLEVASIISTLSDDLSTMTAGVLHDTIEDCGVTADELTERFGSRVAELVVSETEDKLSSLPPEATWQKRKEDSLAVLQSTQDREVMVLWLADKLSNLRSFYRAHQVMGENLWEQLHQKDPAMQAWYYQTIAKAISELNQTAAYAEFVALIQKIFHKGE